MTPKQVESIREGLRRNVRMGADLDAAQATADALLALLRRDWSTQVLDAVAEARGEVLEVWPSSAGVPVPGAGPRVGWRMIGRVTSSLEEARHFAARTLWPTLSVEDKARIGECP